jgi:hypothetical protein
MPYGDRCELQLPDDEDGGSSQPRINWDLDEEIQPVTETKTENIECYLNMEESF